MNSVNEQRELANEIAEALANPVAFGIDFDDVCQSLPTTFNLITIFSLTHSGSPKVRGRGIRTTSAQRTIGRGGSCASAFTPRIESRRQYVHRSPFSSIWPTLLMSLNRITRASFNSSRRRRRSTTQGITSGTGDVIALFSPPPPSFSVSLSHAQRRRLLNIYTFVPSSSFFVKDAFNGETVCISSPGCWAHSISLLSLSPYNVYYLFVDD